LEVLAGVLIFRGVAAADVSAGETEAKMHPTVAYLQALLASLGLGLNGLDFLAVSTSSHGSRFFSKSGNRDAHVEARVAWD
jgi:hypothetical protein